MTTEELAAIVARDSAHGLVVGDIDEDGWTVVSEGITGDDQPATDRRALLALLRECRTALQADEGVIEGEFGAPDPDSDEQRLLSTLEGLEP
jgi:hypothetical protein